MSDRIRYSVLPDETGPDWKVERDGRRLGVWDTKDEAVDAAIQKARDEHDAGALTQVLIRRVDGTFQDERTYGEDPYPPQG
jgi:hypothetical protein